MLNDELTAQSEKLWSKVRKVAEMPGVQVIFGCHDEILFECRDDQVEAVMATLSELDPC